MCSLCNIITQVILSFFFGGGEGEGEGEGELTRDLLEDRRVDDIIAYIFLLPGRAREYAVKKPFLFCEQEGIAGRTRKACLFEENHSGNYV